MATRPRSRLALTLALGILGSACQTAMSIEEAKKATATFGSAPVVPPPRTINDITAILDQQKRTEPEAAFRDQADEAPPQTTDRDMLAQFHFKRGLAAREIGRTGQEIDDLTKAATFGRAQGSPPLHEILYWLGLAEMKGGNFSRAVAHRRKARDLAPVGSPAWSFKTSAGLATAAALLGDLKTAEAALADATPLAYQALGSPGPTGPGWVTATLAQAEASVRDASGRHVEAEASWRKAVAVVARDPVYGQPPQTWLDDLHRFLASNLVRQGRLLEAESEARKALVGALAKRGRYSAHTAMTLRGLVWVLLEQGRYRESETLARAAVDMYEKTGAAPDSLAFAVVRRDLAVALASQGRHAEALHEYEMIRSGLRGDPAGLERVMGVDTAYADVLLESARADRATEALVVALDKTSRLYGRAHRVTAGIRGALGRAYAASGNAVEALREFREATPLLLARSSDVDDEAMRTPAADQRLVGTLGSYIRLLAAIRGTPLEREASIDATAEAFRLADVARGRSVQRAVNASAVRAVAQNRALADLVRREQDARKQVNGLYRLLADMLSRPAEPQDSGAVDDLRRRIDVLRRAIQTLTAQIAKDFPAYTELIDPKPATLDQARALLRPREALIATLVMADRTFVWAVPHAGAVGFAAVPIGAEELKATVATLRKALSPDARTLGDIPDFDVVRAHRLYAALLEPVRSGWQHAQNLLVVAHGPLGQIPFGLLPTKSVEMPAESSLLFSSYRGVPWLIRTHAVTILPSVTSLATLRALPPGDPGRRGFVGFGDPYFSREQAAAAARELTPPPLGDGSGPLDVAAVVTRTMPVRFRSSPEAFDSAQLAKLPRLPDTAEEIRKLAIAIQADETRDVFLGARANEKAVKTLDLTSYRVVAFATHGLAPGDLDGLTQPALALSAPDVAGIEGDGLLTLDEILALRLNADWVVLSACNTGSGQGAGSEAVSGLGRAFFYAGARTLLVSNWPVETTSARALTTDLFRRQQDRPDLSRAEALQQTMTWLIDDGGFVDAKNGRTVFSYAHPIFWAPFTLIGDGGSD